MPEASAGDAMVALSPKVNILLVLIFGFIKSRVEWISGSVNSAIAEASSGRPVTGPAYDQISHSIFMLECALIVSAILLFALSVIPLKNKTGRKPLPIAAAALSGLGLLYSLWMY